MRPRRTLVLCGFSVVFGSPRVWASPKPPDVVYPTTHDQQSLDELLNQHGKDEPEQAAPTPAPMKLQAAEPHPPPPAVPPLPMGEGSQSPKPPSPIRRGSPSAQRRGGEVPAAAPKKLNRLTSYRVYIWQETGDTLWRIAQKVYGDKDKWPLIYQANRDVIKDPNKIYPKQVLKIPPIDWQP